MPCGKSSKARRRALRHNTPIEAEIDMLHRLLDEFDKHANDARMLVALNRRFHGAVCEAAHNRYLIATLAGMHDAMALLHSNTFRMPNRRSEFGRRAPAHRAGDRAPRSRRGREGGAASRPAGAADAVCDAGLISVRSRRQLCRRGRRVTAWRGSLTLPSAFASAALSPRPAPLPFFVLGGSFGFGLSTTLDRVWPALSCADRPGSNSRCSRA